MSRVQLALNVNDIDEAVSFYTKLFGTEQATQCCGGPRAAGEDAASAGALMSCPHLEDQPIKLY